MARNEKIVRASHHTAYHGATVCSAMPGRGVALAFCVQRSAAAAARLLCLTCFCTVVPWRALGLGLNVHAQHVQQSRHELSEWREFWHQSTPMRLPAAAPCGPRRFSGAAGAAGPLCSCPRTSLLFLPRSFRPPMGYARARRHGDCVLFLALVMLKPHDVPTLLHPQDEHCRGQLSHRRKQRHAQVVCEHPNA